MDETGRLLARERQSRPGLHRRGHRQPQCVTSVDPDRIDVLFERFVSRERNEPPDIDIDFEHERREEVIQHIYQKYGRDRAAMIAAVVTYQRKSSIREVSKVFGID